MARGRAAHPILQGAIARIIAIVPTAVGQLVATRLVLEHYDRATYNTYILAFSTMVLIPLNSLGAGTAVITAFAEEGAEGPRARRVLLTAARVMTISAIVLAGAAFLLSALDLWPGILGDGTAAGATFGYGLIIYAFTFIPGLGQSILLGVNKNHLSIIVQALLAPSMAIGVAICVALDAGTSILIMVPAMAVAVTALLNALVSSVVTKVHWAPLLARIPRVRHFPGAEIRSLAGPALFLSITGPLAMETDRLVLSHRSTAAELTNYSITVQLFAPVITIVVAAAQPLWPTFAKARAEGTPPPSMGKLTAVFGALAAVASAAVILISGPASRIVGGDDIDLGIFIPVSMGILVIGQATGLPVVMALKDAAGLRLTAWLSVIALPINLGLSLALAPSMGAPGPILATMLAGTPLQGIPMLVHYRRRRLAEAAQGPPATAEEQAAAQEAAFDAQAAMLGVPRLDEVAVLSPGNWVDPYRAEERRRLGPRRTDTS